MPKNPRSYEKTRHIALSGLLFALAMALSFIEGSLVIPGLLPGMKLGLANIVVMYALFFMGVKQALVLDVLKAVRFSGVRLHGGVPLAVRRPVVAAGHGRAVLCGAGAAHLVHPFGLRRTGPQCGAAAGGRRYHLVVAVTVLCAGHAGAGPGNGRTDVHYPQGTAAGTGAAGVQHPRKAGRITDATAAAVAF